MSDESERDELWERLEALAWQVGVLREDLKREKAATATALAERDAGQAREDAIVARAMALHRERDRLTMTDSVAITFDAGILRISKNWRDLFAEQCAKLLRETDTYLTRAPQSHEVSAP